MRFDYESHGDLNEQFDAVLSNIIRVQNKHVDDVALRIFGSIEAMKAEMLHVPVCLCYTSALERPADDASRLTFRLPYIGVEKFCATHGHYVSGPITTREGLDAEIARYSENTCQQCEMLRRLHL